MLVQGNRVLMQLRDNIPNIYEPGKWSFPSGKIEKGEKAFDAIKREFKEETGYILSQPKLILDHRMVYEKGNFDWHVFVEEYDGKQKIECFEGQRMEFFNLGELRKKDLARKNLEVIESHFNNNRKT